MLRKKTSVTLNITFTLQLADQVIALEDQGEGTAQGMVGFTDDRTIDVTARAALFTLAKPESGAEIKYNDRWYEITRVEDTPDGAALNITAEEKP